MPFALRLRHQIANINATFQAEPCSTIEWIMRFSDTQFFLQEASTSHRINHPAAFKYIISFCGFLQNTYFVQTIITIQPDVINLTSLQHLNTHLRIELLKISL